MKKESILLWQIIITIALFNNIIPAKKKVILCGIKDVLFRTNLKAIPGASIGSFIGYTPEFVENELYQLLHQTPFSRWKKKTSGIYSPLLCYWLTTNNSSTHVRQVAQQHVRKTCWLIKKTRLLKAAEIAFTPELIARVLTPNRSVLSLLKTCKKNGYKIVICSNWNTESYQAMLSAHRSIFTMFDDSFISADIGALTYEPPFFRNLLSRLNVSGDDCILIDTQPETIAGAKQAGIRTIPYKTTSALTQTLRSHGIS